MASEKLRRREVHKYYHSWLNSSIGFDASAQPSRHQADGSDVRASKDQALIAFAQLGCLRLDVKRSIVVLISTDYLYVLAEATKTLSLVSGNPDLEAQDEVWFGNASLPRRQGVSGDALFPPMYTAVGRDGSTFVAPALVVNDITNHDQYRSREYAGRGVTFYCGVPILTDSGYPIGVYTVTDDKPRDGLTPSELRFMYDMAATVMRHLDTVSNEAARFRGETMVLGLGRFISGAASKDEPTPGRRKSSAGPVLRNYGDAAAADDTYSGSRVFKGMEITSANPSVLRKNIAKAASSPEPSSPDVKPRKKAAGEPAVPEKEVQWDPLPSPTEVTAEVGAPTATKKPPSVQSHTAAHPYPDPAVESDHIFSRAASILQECIAADGVLFFEAVSSSFARRSNIMKPPDTNEHKTTDSTPHDTSRTEDVDNAAVLEAKTNNTAVYSGASEESDVGPSHDSEQRLCRLLGYSLDDPTESSLDTDALKDVQITERSLSRLIKMYPNGKLFTFEVDGGVSASDGDPVTEDALNSVVSKLAKPGKFSTSDKSKRIPRAVADELERLVPHAQSVVWLPLWDFVRQRWSAGMFLWSRRIDRLVAAQDDLVYLRAFGNSIMVEVARRDAALADTAKATFIANISHELRTPLHGVVGNLDILQDTELTEFQESLVTAIEVCGRTLSDTIDHVLEYSKINQLSKHNRKRNKSGSMPWQLPLLGNNTHTQSGTSVTEVDFDVAAIIEEAVESAYASHVFQTTGRTRLRGSSISEEQHSQSSTASPTSQKVYVTIDIEHQPTWWVHSQPSAIRRVVTNLFGNALKYTDSGSIQVMLSSRRPTKTSDPMSHMTLLLTIKDTGRGMSTDFVRNHAFVPFSQESQFSTGTGLGLSIVQQIVKSLGGQIELQSDQGSGTEMRVLLNLPRARKEEATSRNEASVQHGLDVLREAGLWIQVLPAEGHDVGQIPAGVSLVAASLSATAQTWFGLNTIKPGSTNNKTPDFVVFVTPPTPEEILNTSASLNSSSQTRYLVLAANLLQKADLSTKYADVSTQAGIQVDVLWYPIGPQKLGKALLRCLNLNKAQGSPGEDEKSRSSLRDRAMSKRKFQEMAKDGSATLTQSNQMMAQPYPRREGSVTAAVSAPNTHHLRNEKATRQRATAQAAGIEGEAEVPGPAVSSDQRHSVTPRSLSAPSSLPTTSSILDFEPSLRILLVDDNEINLAILKTCMKRAQIPYDTAKDGLQATVAFEAAVSSKTPFSHVLMDISMPVMDGIQATREIRNFERRRNNLEKTSSRVSEPQDQETAAAEASEEATDTPGMAPRTVIIALSGVAAETTQCEMLEAGADMFMPKPVKLKELLRLLQT